MRRQRERNTILVLQQSLLRRDSDEMDGIAAYAHEAGWTVQTVEYGTATVSRFHGQFGENGADVRSLLSLWRPAGCIVECGGEAPLTDPRIFGRVPVVYLDCPPQVGGRSVFCVSSDAESIAKHAARELLSLGFADHAFVPWPKDTLWSRERCNAFSRLLALNGKSVHVFDAKAGLNPVEWQEALARWVVSLPKPCGVFAANDWCAEQVVGICSARRIDVPDAVAVLGVDNDTELCESATVSISSIATDNVLAGRLAAELLAARMAGAAGVPRVRTFGATGLVRRASTARFKIADRRVADAIEHIRLHACEGLEVGEVVKVMGCSRRWAEIRFREVTGHSILDEIHEVRFARACELLSKRRLMLEAVARECGYGSPSFLRSYFKKRTGQTLREWRNARSLSAHEALGR